MAYDAAGIRLPDGKEALVSARVARRMRALSIATHVEYLEFLLGDKSGAELVQFLDAITTNFTTFYREPDHFEVLQRELDDIYRSGQRQIRIWCAASSSGEEPYPLAITLAEWRRRQGSQLDIKLLASDISVRMLKAASQGIYSAERVSTVAPELRKRYLRPLEPSQGEESPVQVVPELREMVLFRRLNLAKLPYPFRGPLDAVFCRNVLIYLDERIRANLVQEMERLVRPGRLLITSHTETLSGISRSFQLVKPSVYRRPAANPRRPAGAVRTGSEQRS